MLPGFPPEASSGLHSYLQCTRMSVPHSRANRMCCPNLLFHQSYRWEVLFYLHFSFIVMRDCEHVFTWLSFLFPFFFLVNCLFIPAFLLDFYPMSFNDWVLCMLVILFVVYTARIFSQFFTWLLTSLQFLCPSYVAK